MLLESSMMSTRSLIRNRLARKSIRFPIIIRFLERDKIEVKWSYHEADRLNDFVITEYENIENEENMNSKLI